MNDRCAGAGTCGTCTPMSGCGWCGALGRCLAGTESGPAGTSCPSGWAWLPTECGGGTTCSCVGRVRPEQLRDGLVWELCVGASMLQWTMRDRRHDLHVRGPGVRSQQLRDGFVWELCVGAGVLQWTMRDGHVELHESHELCCG